MTDNAPQHTPQPPAGDLAQFIDAQPVSRFQVRLLLLCGAVLFVDGFDTQAIGYVAPALTKEWSLPRGGLGPVLSAALIGLTLGALALGPLADRIGRKRIIVLSTLVFGTFSLATIFADSTQTLIILRFLTGLGLGGAMPNAVALTAEFSPHRRRATMVMTMFCGFSIGAAVGGLLAAYLIPAFGWRAVFLVGGVVPILLVPVLALRLPESIRFLALRSDQAGVAELLSRAFPDAARSTNVQAVEHATKNSGVAGLFGEGRAPTTLLLWVVFSMSLLDLYLLSNWLPTILNELGASIAASAAIGALLQVGGVVGTITLGRLIDRFSFRALAVVYLLAAVAVSAIGFSGHALLPASLAIFAAGFCIVGGQISANALAANYYPTAIRATGVGWALGIGRIGSIAGPLIGGVLLARQMSPDSLFLSAAIPAVTASVAAFFLSRTA